MRRRDTEEGQRDRAIRVLGGDLRETRGVVLDLLERVIALEAALQDTNVAATSFTPPEPRSAAEAQDIARDALALSPEAVQAGDARMENAPTEEGN